MKICSKCKLSKSIEEFAKHPNGKNGLRAECRQCKGKHNKLWHEKLKAAGLCRQGCGRSIIVGSHCMECREKHNLTRMTKYYGITPQERKLLGDSCEICKRVLSGRNIQLDHKHREGLSVDRCVKEDVRGILCSTCNVLVSRVETLVARNSSLLREIAGPLIISYLENPPAQIILNSFKKEGVINNDS